MTNGIRKHGLDIGGTYVTIEPKDYLIERQIDGYFVGRRADGSQRLFYPNGQYVGASEDRDLVGFSPRLL